MADEWNYESSLTWDSGGVIALEALPIMLTRAAATFSLADSSLDISATPLPVRIERIGLPLVARAVRPSSIKVITGIWPLIHGNPGDVIQVYVGVQQDAPTEVPVYEGPFAYTIGQTEFIDTLVSGRYACVRFESELVQPWTLVSFELDFAEIGIH